MNAQKRRKKAAWQKSFAKDKCCLFDSVTFPVGSTMLSNETSDSCTIAAVKCVDLGGRLGPAINIRNVCPVCTTTSPTTSATNGEEPVEISCADGWKMHQGTCYKVFYSKTTWSKAEEACTQIGGHLASVHDLHTNNFIKSLISSGNFFWLGGYQPTSDSAWTWSDKSIFNYENWGAGEPNNHNGNNEDCLALVKSWGGKWNDGPCDYLNYDGYVCQNL